MSTRRAPVRALLTIAGVAEILGTSERHVRALVYRRGIPYLKVGRLVRFDPDDVQRWLDAQRVETRSS